MTLDSEGKLNGFKHLRDFCEVVVEREHAGNPHSKFGQGYKVDVMNTAFLLRGSGGQCARQLRTFVSKSTITLGDPVDMRTNLLKAKIFFLEVGYTGRSPSPETA